MRDRVVYAGSTWSRDAVLRRRPSRRTATTSVTVPHPYDGRAVGRTTLATPDQVEAAVAAAAAVAAEAAALPAHARAAALDHVSRRLAERAEEIAALITAENGKPLKWARAEVGPGGVHVPLGRRGGPPLLRRVAAARHRPRRDRPDRPGPAGAARAGAGHRAVQLPAQPGRAQGRPGASRSARRSSSSRRRRRRCPRCCSARSWPRPTCRPACSRSCRCPTTAPPTWSPTRGCRWSRSPAPARSARRSATPVPRQARHAGAGRQRRGGGLRGLAPTRTSTGPRTRIATFANYQAGQCCIAVQRVYRARPRATTTSCPGWSRRCEALRDRRPGRPSRPTSAR